MDKEEILAMEAGGNLDELIEVHLFGLVRGCRDDGSRCWKDKEGNPVQSEAKPYSTDISIAWQVKDKMREELFSVRRRFLNFLEELSGNDIGGGVTWPNVFWFITPETICKAALLVKIKS